jgi:hypothetical protein
MFLVYINDININIESDIKLFADDTTLIKTLDNNDPFDILNNDLERINKWSVQWRITFNPNKTEFMIFSNKVSHQTVYPTLYLNRVRLKEVDEHKHIGLILSKNLSWRKHITEICKKANKHLDVMFRMKRLLPRICLEKLYKTIVRPILDYGDMLYDNCLNYESEFFEKVQRRAAILSMGAFKITKHIDLLNELGLSPLHIRRKIHRLTLFYKIKIKQCPNYLSDSCPLVNHNTENYNLRRKDFVLPLIYIHV